MSHANRTNIFLKNKIFMSNMLTGYFIQFIIEFFFHNLLFVGKIKGMQEEIEKIIANIILFIISKSFEVKVEAHARTNG